MLIFRKTLCVVINVVKCINKCIRVCGGGQFKIDKQRRMLVIVAINLDNNLKVEKIINLSYVYRQVVPKIPNNYKTLFHFLLHKFHYADMDLDYKDQKLKTTRQWKYKMCFVEDATKISKMFECL